MDKYKPVTYDVILGICIRIFLTKLLSYANAVDKYIRVGKEEKKVKFN